MCAVKDHMCMLGETLGIKAIIKFPGATHYCIQALLTAPACSVMPYITLRTFTASELASRRAASAALYIHVYVMIVNLQWEHRYVWL